MPMMTTMQFIAGIVASGISVLTQMLCGLNFWD